MTVSLSTPEYDWQSLGFETNQVRFDQKNDMFKRAIWDPDFVKWGDRFYGEVVYRDDRPGWSKAERVLLETSWNIENVYGQSILHSGHDMLAWNGICSSLDKYASAGDKVQETPEDMSAIIRSAAMAFGAGSVGVAPIHESWIYSHEYDMENQSHSPIDLPKGLTSAVVMTVPMDYELLRNQSMVIQGVATGMGYSLMAIMANQMAAYIRALGYKAVPCGNDTALSIPLAMAAGLGECSRMGLLVTPKHGPRVRLCKVLTDMPLKFDSYKPFGVAEFCRICMTCARKCPSQAISYGEPISEGLNPASHGGVTKWYVDCEKCFTYWAVQRCDCTRCVSVCPFNKPDHWFHDVTRWLIENTPILNRPIYWGDRLLGYEKPYKFERFRNMDD